MLRNDYDDLNDDTSDNWRNRSGLLPPSPDNYAENLRRITAALDSKDSQQTDIPEQKNAGKTVQKTNQYVSHYTVKLNP